MSYLINKSSSFPEGFMMPILQGITIYFYAAYKTLVKVESKDKIRLKTIFHKRKRNLPTKLKEVNAPQKRNYLAHQKTYFIALFFLFFYNA